MKVDEEKVAGLRGEIFEDGDRRSTAIVVDDGHQRPVAEVVACVKD